MAQSSKIEWTEATWNPVTGCTPISEGCLNCYAKRMAMRLQAMGNKRYVNGFNVTLHHDLLEMPFKWRSSKLVFVNSMSDLFHEQVPIEYINLVFDTMRKATQHTFQVLTKRAERMVDVSGDIIWPENVWMGVTVESGEYEYRIDLLRQIPAAVRFLSIEPMIGPAGKISLENIDWVIVGGESGPRSRPILKEWVDEVKDQCLAANVPFFFKQWGGFNKKKTGRLLDGRVWNQIPAISQEVCA